jgi:hypothetical protein
MRRCKVRSDNWLCLSVGFWSDDCETPKTQQSGRYPDPARPPADPGDPAPGLGPPCADYDRAREARPGRAGDRGRAAMSDIERQRLRRRGERHALWQTALALRRVALIRGRDPRSRSQAIRALEQATRVVLQELDALREEVAGSRGQWEGPP